MTLYLLAGAAAGYALLMWSNPVKASLLDGLRAVQRYPRLWVLLGLFGFGYALFQLGLRIFFHAALPAGEGPPFLWSRAPFQASWQWVAGTSDSLWSRSVSARDLAHGTVLPTLDSLGGLFNNLVPTFPIAALAAVLLLVNWGGHQTVLFRALRKRFRRWGILLHLAILIAALAALARPLLYVAPRLLTDPALGDLWYRWAPIVGWLAFLFEYLLGVGVQVYLLLLAYVWVRGLTFRHGHLLDFAIRRFAFVVRWAGVVMLLSTLFIDVPLIRSVWFEPEATAIDVDRRNALARFALNAIFLACASVQITLTFHNESLRRSLRDHFHFVCRHAGPLLWFILIAGLHFFALHFLNALCLDALGDGTALWIAWGLLFPWLAGFVGAWLLSAWVSFFRRADSGRIADKEWVRF